MPLHLFTSFEAVAMVAAIVKGASHRSDGRLLALILRDKPGCVVQYSQSAGRHKNLN